MSNSIESKSAIRMKSILKKKKKDGIDCVKHEQTPKENIIFLCY